MYFSSFETRWRALTRPAPLLPPPSVRGRGAEPAAKAARAEAPSATLSALSAALLAPKPPKEALNPRHKPPHAPTVVKWYKKGGSIERLDNRHWKYTDWEHNAVVYEGDFPNFTPYQRQQVDIPNMV